MDGTEREWVVPDPPPVAVSWEVRDAIAYALGTGATPPDEIDELYEGRGPRPLATFGSCLATRWIPHLRRSLGPAWVPGVITSHRWRSTGAVPPEGRAEVRWRASASATSRGALVEVTARLEVAGGPSVEATTVILHRERPPGLALPTRPRVAPAALPTGPARWTRVTTSAQQAAAFRLLLPLTAGTRAPDAFHIDPEVAAGAGLAAPILHGPAVEGVLARGCLRAGLRHTISAMETDFTGVVVPGDELVLRAWDDDDRPGGLLIAATGPGGAPVATVRLGAVDDNH